MATQTVGSKSESRWKRWLGSLASSPLLWLLPLILVLLTTFVYPIINIVRLGFTNAGLTSESYSYTLDSFTGLLNSAYFLTIMQATVFFVIGSIVFQMIFGFLIALLVDQGAQRGMRSSVITRTAVLSAWAIPGVIIGIIWSILYQESGTGVLNYLLSSIGFGQVAFLSDPQTALISVTVANIWRGTAFSMILIYAGFQTLPRDILEAARVDGASAWQRLIRIVLPLLAPIILIDLIIVSIDTFNTFDMVLALTGGGPGRSTEVLALSIYNQIFEQFDLGAGAATAVVLLAVNAVVTAVYLRLENTEEMV